jgi:hypothetical protein
MNRRKSAGSPVKLYQFVTVIIGNSCLLCRHPKTKEVIYARLQ